MIQEKAHLSQAWLAYLKSITSLNMSAGFSVLVTKKAGPVNI